MSKAIRKPCPLGRVYSLVGEAQHEPQPVDEGQHGVHGQRLDRAPDDFRVLRLKDRPQHGPVLTGQTLTRTEHTDSVSEWCKH